MNGFSHAGDGAGAMVHRLSSHWLRDFCYSFFIRSIVDNIITLIVNKNNGQLSIFFKKIKNILWLHYFKAKFSTTNFAK